MLRARAFTIVASLVVFAAACGGGTDVPPIDSLKLTSITIDGIPPLVERGTDSTLTATAHTAAGVAKNIPFVWRSTADSILTFGLKGHFTVGDTGLVAVTASALGVTSAPFGVRVVWFSAAAIAVSRFSPPIAVDPGGTPGDSIRVLVTNTAGGAAKDAKVVFAVTAGGGSVSPTSATVPATGVVAAQWILGPLPGKNTVTATVVGKDSLPIKWVKDNPATFSITTYVALSAVAGDKQTGAILSALPVAPSVKLVDSAGRPRPGVPIAFTASNNGRVAKTTVSTSADGTASPGVWTLGDAAGDQQLIATVESATLTLHATATGTTVQFAATQLATAQQATCAVTSDQFVSCFGQYPQTGTGDTVNVSTPTLIKGGIHYTSVVGGGAHFCGISTDLAILCWGAQALADTLGIFISSNFPIRMQGNIAWLQVSPGAQHNCALASDHTAWCWGGDASGQLGDNGTTTRFAPRQVLGGFKFSALAAGAAHECALQQSDGAAFCWGFNSNGELGDGTTENRGAPTAVIGGSKFQAIGAGSAWTCGLGTGATLGKTYCWGAGTSHTVPVEYFGVPSFTSLSVGSAHACALTSDGTAYCWGTNSFGELGDGTTTNRANPTAVAGGLHFTSISAGVDQTCGITTDGFVACWGRNLTGEIGVSPAVTQQLTPRLIILGVTP